MSTLRSFGFLATVVALLSVIAALFPQPQAEFGGVKLHFASLNDYLYPQDSVNNQPLADTLLHEVEHLIDSAQMRRTDTLNHYHCFFAYDPARFALPDSNIHFFDRFFAALDSARCEPIHIAHYGDSQIEGDRITAFFRQELQKRFGGSGPGLIPLYQPVQTTSLRQMLTDSVPMFYAGGMIGARGTSNDYGAMASYARVNSSNLQLDVRLFEKQRVNRVKVFAASGEHAELKATLAGSEKLFDQSQLTTNDWLLRNSTSHISISLEGKGRVYGVALDSIKGVSVSNLPFRGSDGLFFTRIEKKHFAQMHSELNTRLVILEFGGNAVPSIPDTARAERYCRGLAKQIEYVKSACPQADVVVIGPADMSVKIGAKLQTHPMLPYVVEAMRRTTTSCGAAFWNMYDVMGGENSMIAWVEHKPRWAATDYIHFTRKGVEQIATVLCESLMMYYDFRSFENRWRAEQ